MRRLLKASVRTALAAGAAVALTASGAQAASTPGWRIAALFPQMQNMLSVSATSRTNAWAVGIFEGGTPCDPCLFETQWTGRKWVVQPAQFLGYDYAQDAAVAAISGERAWVFYASTDEELGISEVDATEWTGTSWSAPHTFPGQWSAGTATATGPNDVWDFGSEVVHYNGKSWSQVPVPLSSFTDSGSPQAGVWLTGTVTAQPSRVEIVHWSNGAWKNAALPKISVPTGDQMLPGLIAANTTADIWATIGVGPASGHGAVTTLLHWNGKAWSHTVVPKQSSLASLAGLASDGHGGAWVAWNTTDKYRNPTGVLMYHYAAGRWTRVTAPAKAGYNAQLASNLQLIPGAQSVLSATSLWPFSGNEVGAVAKYGP